MEQLLDKLNRLYDKHKQSMTGDFHNCLWQIMINGVRDLTKGDSCFVLLIKSDEVVLADRFIMGYVRTQFQFHHQLPLPERYAIMHELNQEIFGLTQDQTALLEASTFSGLG